MNQIIDDINFEEIKARTAEIILRNEAGGAQLAGIVENKPGEVNGRDCLIH